MTDESPDPTKQGFLLDRRRFLLGAAAAGGLGALALAGCSSSGSGGGGDASGRPTVRLSDGATGFPSPFASNADFGYQQMSLLYDTLLWTDGEGNLLPWLAESYKSSEDHLTYTFELREGLKWSDGRPATVDDVVFTFEYYAKQGQLSPAAIIQPPQGIAKVVATGPNTVEFTLTTPAVTFPAQVTGAVPIIPRHVWESIARPAEALDLNVLVGTGPYRVEQYNDDGGAILFTARDDYFLGAPYVKRIEMRALQDSFTALLSGESDVLRSNIGMRDDTTAQFRGDEFGKISNIGDFVTSQLYWNLGKGGALADVRFRQACAMAIDRRELVTRLSAGKGEPGNPGFLSPTNPYYTPVRAYDFDVAGANALLDSAGYRMGNGGIRQGPDGKPLSFEFRFDNVDGVPMSEIVIPAIRRIGVELRPTPKTIGPDLFAPKLFGGYEMGVFLYPGPSPTGPNSDPDVLRNMFSSRVPPFSLTAANGYKNPVFDDLADRQLATFDEGERRRIVDQMQKIVADDIPVLSLFYPEKTLIFRKRVLDNWYFTPGQFPTAENNKQLFVTGAKGGTKIRSSG